MATPIEDRELLRQAQAGDRDAFDRVTCDYRPRLAALVRERLGETLSGQLEVDDVLQETLLRAFRSLGRFKQETDESLFRWLAGIAVNVLCEEIKRAPRTPQAVFTAECPAEDASVATTLRREERFDRLEDAVKKLPPDYRQVIQLTRFKKLPPDEVARRMKRSRQAVRNLLMRALRALKESFGDTESLHLPPRSLEQ